MSRLTKDFDVDLGQRAKPLSWGMRITSLPGALALAAILCFFAFLSARTGTWGVLNWLDFGARPENFLPAGALSLAIPWWGLLQTAPKEGCGRVCYECEIPSPHQSRFSP